MVVLKFGFVDDPEVLANFQLTDGDPRFTLRLAEEMISPPVLIRSLIATAPAMALANKGLPHSLVLIGLVATFRVSKPRQPIKLVEFIHELLTCPLPLLV